MADDVQSALTRKRIDPPRTVPYFPLTHSHYLCRLLTECGCNRESERPRTSQRPRRQEALGDCWAPHAGKRIYTRLPARHQERRQQWRKGTAGAPKPCEYQRVDEPRRRAHRGGLPHFLPTLFK